MRREERAGVRGESDRALGIGGLRHEADVRELRGALEGAERHRLEPARRVKWVVIQIDRVPATRVGARRQRVGDPRSRHGDRRGRASQIADREDLEEDVAGGPRVRCPAHVDDRWRRGERRGRRIGGAVELKAQIDAREPAQRSRRRVKRG